MAGMMAADGADPFAAAVRSTRVSMVISNPLLPDNPIVFANDAFCQLTGYTPDEVLGRNCRFLQGDATSPAVIARIREAISCGEPIETDLCNYRRDGTPFWNHMTMSPVRDAAGRIIFFVASQTDVTPERQRLTGLVSDNQALAAELQDRLQAQAESEARLLMATRAGRLGIWELDLATVGLTTSSTAREIFGRNPAEPFSYAQMLAQIHPADRARVAAIASGSDQAGTAEDDEYRVIRPDGSIVWLQLRAQAWRSPPGAALRVAGVAMDVTTRKRAEQRLELSEEALRLATVAADVGTWDLDLATNTLTLSDRTKAMFGVAPEVPCTLDDFYAGLHPEDRAAASAALAATLDPARRATYDVEYRTVGRDDGAVRWVAAKGRAMFDASGTCIRALGTAIDITARRAEATRKAFLLNLLDDLRALTDPQAITEAALTALGRHLGVCRAGYGTVRPDGRVARLETGYTLRPAEPRSGALRLDLLGNGSLARLRQGAPIAVPDTAALPPADGAWDSPETRAFAAVPLLREGGLAAFLFVGHASPRPWPEQELALIADVAARLWDVVARAKAEAELRSANAALERQVIERTAACQASERRMRAVFETSYQLKGLLARSGVVVDLNATALATIGQSLSAVAGQLFWETPWFSRTPGVPARIRAAVLQAARGEETRTQITVQVPAGLRTYDLSVRPIRDAEGEVVAILPEAIDITERRQAEEQLRQAQKMEAVGQLTGGIAHDFNNLLTGILGSLELLHTRIAEGRTDGLMRYAAGASAAAQRAAALTQRLLAFARRQPLDPKAMDTNRLLLGMQDLLAHTLGPSIRLRLNLAPDLWPALSDTHQLENALLNLAINARDAMPGGGELTIATRNAELDHAYAARQGGEVRPGHYVAVSIADSGVGMTPDVLAKAFDPFFTTKPLGQGTGLGLSMLYGFITQSRGHVCVVSQPGNGTTFTLHLPRHDAPASLAAPGENPAAQAQEGAGETILVVEDETTVRMLVAETLHDLGYATLEAADGPAGLAILQSDARIDLLLTDVGLPGLNGRQLADAARLHRPALRVLFMTGYAHNAAIGQGEAFAPGMGIISKPFALEALATKVGAMIEGRAEPVA